MISIFYKLYYSKYYFAPKEILMHRLIPKGLLNIQKINIVINLLCDVYSCFYHNCLLILHPKKISTLAFFSHF